MLQLLITGDEFQRNDSSLFEILKTTSIEHNALTTLDEHQKHPVFIEKRSKEFHLQKGFKKSLENPEPFLKQFTKSLLIKTESEINHLSIQT